ncbi:MAG: hypothetical protein R8M46_06180 [Ghiorsea sp.]
MSEPIIFTPDNEPYLGLEPLMVFDHMIVAAFKLSAEVASYTHQNKLNRLQKAAAQIVPQGLNIALSMRELIRQGHLFAAAVFMRSLIERVGILTYLLKEPSGIDKWESGGLHQERPSLNTMLKTLSNGGDVDAIKATVDTYNHLVHGDPMSTRFNLVNLDDDALGYGVGRVIDNSKLCDSLCDQTLSWLIVLTGKTGVFFPECKEPANNTD